MTYTRVNWADSPSTTTPINAANLNIMDAGIAAASVGSSLLAGSFSSYLSTNQSRTANAFSVIPFDTAEFNNSTWMDLTSNKGRYTPQVAGVYRFSTCIEGADPGSGSQWIARLYKNGSYYKPLGAGVGGAGNPIFEGSSLASANGTTDYFEVYLAVTSGTQTLFSGASSTFFQGSIVAAS